jgi:2-polyprenyl-6-hydroxyphenyl methylase/3-demethylubiquinone-9 3-methyltransferase
MKAELSVDPEEIARFSAMAEEWWDERGKFRPLHLMNPVRMGFIRDQAIQHFGLDGTSFTPLEKLRAVDIGCGGGLVCEPMARLGAAITGVDASENNIRIATSHAKQSGLPIEYRHATAEALVAEGKTFDIVLALEVVEHVASVPDFIDACAALLKPGGLLFLSTLNRTLKSYAMAIVGAEYVMRWLPRGTHEWKKFLPPHRVAAELRRNNIEIQEMKGLVFDPLRWQWKLSKSNLDVNYLLAAVK